LKKRFAGLSASKQDPPVLHMAFVKATPRLALPHHCGEFSAYFSVIWKDLHSGEELWIEAGAVCLARPDVTKRYWRA
jgi:hypothetical protein